MPGAGGVSETPACLGRRFRLAEGASQKPFDGISTRGSQRPDDSQGRALHMEQEDGAFKVKSEESRLQAAASLPSRAFQTGQHALILDSDGLLILYCANAERNVSRTAYKRGSQKTL